VKNNIEGSRQIHIISVTSENEMGCQEGITYNHETILKEKHLVVFYICVCVCVCVCVHWD
jgi:hypothetical protein